MAVISEAWTVEIGGAGSGDLTEYGKAYPVEFEDRLNAPGFFKVNVEDLEGNAEPARDDLVRLVWDKGGSSEQTHFEGYITDKRQRGSSSSFELQGFSLDGLLWQSGIGGIREYTSVRPHDVISTSTSPSSLMVTADGTNISIGSTTLDYAADDTVANQIDSDNEGGFGTSGGSLTTGDFRAASDRQLVNIYRLCMVGRENTSDFGLEYHALLVNGTGSNEPTEPRFALAHRRERASSYTPETFTIDQDFAPAKRGEEGVTAADFVKVIGEGTGSADREESVDVGSGKLQRIIADKTVINQTNADNMANRLQGLLDPSTEVVTGWYYDHGTDTRAGDDVTIAESGVSDTTLRVFSRYYSFETKGFRIVAGRPKAREQSAQWNIENQLGGYSQGPQKTDFQRPPGQNRGSSTHTFNSSNLGSVAANTVEDDKASFSSDIDLTKTDWVFCRIQPRDPTNNVDWLIEVAASDEDPYNSNSQFILGRKWYASYDPGDTGYSTDQNHAEEVLDLHASETGIGPLKTYRVRVSHTNSSSQDIEVQLSWKSVDEHQHN